MDGTTIHTKKNIKQTTERFINEFLLTMADIFKFQVFSFIFLKPKLHNGQWLMKNNANNSNKYCLL